MSSTPRKKLIEVSIPLEAINKASAREKSIRHGHPSTLHLWWARRPLAACRAVLFAQLVDDPSAWPEKFPTEAEQEKERLRLHRIIEDMVPWEASNNETILNAARWEIARSVAWGLGEEPPERGDGKAILAYLQEKAPPVYDPFSGGGSIPLEAQRLGLRAYGSDLNPVAVLIGKALVEIPPKFAGMPPVNPSSQAELKRGHWNGKGAQGLAEDVRYYGQWMRDEAHKRIGHLYPKAKLKDGTEATVIAWLWARMVRSPDPAARGAMVPLVTSFMLSTKASEKAWVEPVLDHNSPDGWHFVVHSGNLSKVDEAEKRKGTKAGGSGASFQCILTGASIPFDYIRSEAKAGRMSDRLMVTVAEAPRGRTYESPTSEQEVAAAQAKCDAPIEGDLPPKALGFRVQEYGMLKWMDLFTQRQLVALTTLSDLVGEARRRVIADSADAVSDKSEFDKPLHAGGNGVEAYADAVATYLSFANSRMADRHSTLTRWDPNPSGYAPKIANTFSRHALPMVWDHTEGNPFSASSGNFEDAVTWVTKNIAVLGAFGPGSVRNIDAAKNSFPIRPVVFSTDPPYYDNIGYADLSDYFYVWLRRSIGDVWPDLFRRLSTPKLDELIASPFRQGSKSKAERFFMDGMSAALAAMRDAGASDELVTIYYAFKQSELDEEGITSAGWSSFLQAIVDARLSIDGTWPLRTELSNRIIAKDSNALASSIVLVCRKRSEGAGTTDRAGFISALRRELPDAIAKIRAAGVGPVDMQQSVIGPGMGVFSRYAEVLDDDDMPLQVKAALAIINRVWQEIDSELLASFDAPTQVALAWFGSFSFDSRSSGELIGLATAKDTAIEALFTSGVFQNLHGKAALTPREQLPTNWSPAQDKSLTVWECVQHTARALNSPDGGASAAGRLISEMGPRAADARALLDRLFQIATDKGWAQEALVYNQLAEEWPHLLERASSPEVAAATATTGDLFT